MSKHLSSASTHASDFASTCQEVNIVAYVFVSHIGVSSCVSRI